MTPSPPPYLIREQDYYRPSQTVIVNPPAPRQRLWLHLLLFALTVVSTVFAGGWVFSLSLLAILTCHEFGHYLTARRYGVPVSLPYFIPFPFPFSLFGTLGAFIRMSPRIPNRRALFDIAAAGPLAGLVVALPVTFFGIRLSEIVQKSAIPANSVSLAEPLLFKGLSWIVFGSTGPDTDLMLHPMAFAGWAGMFVTALNLLPIGQLDGGHVSHALFGSRSRIVAFAMFAGLIGVSFWSGKPVWVPMMLLLLLLGIQHPPTYDDGVPLGSVRKVLGFVLGLVFVTCFSLVPIKF